MSLQPSPSESNWHSPLLSRRPEGQVAHSFDPLPVQVAQEASQVAHCWLVVVVHACTSYWPDEHAGLQLGQNVLPWVLLNVPAAQLWQLVAPVLGLNWPAAQSVHALLP